MLETKCSTCLGCNRLEDINFNGVSSCNNYVRATPTLEDNINKIKEILGIQEEIQWKRNY